MIAITSARCLEDSREQHLLECGLPSPACPTTGTLLLRWDKDWMYKCSSKHLKRGSKRLLLVAPGNGEENLQGLAPVVFRVGWWSCGGGGARHSEGPTVIFEEYCKLNWWSSLGLPTSWPMRKICEQVQRSWRTSKDITQTFKGRWHFFTFSVDPQDKVF